MKQLIFLFLLSACIYANNTIPQMFQSIDRSDDEFVKKIVLSKDEKRLLVISRDSADLFDAKSFKLIHSLSFSGSAWDGDFAENGIVLLTHHDFTYFSEDGKKILYRLDRQDVGSFKAIDVPDQGHNVNIIKENGNYEQTTYFNQRLKGLMQLNLRTKKFKPMPYEDHYKTKQFLKDIKDNVLQISKGDHENTYIDITTNTPLTPKDIQYTTVNTHKILSPKNIIQDSYHSLTGLSKGCVSSDTKRYALFDKGGFKVYDEGDTNPILSISSMINPFPVTSCLIYGDTLVLASMGILHYNIKDDSALFSSIAKANRIEPVIGTCKDDSFAISLWNGVSYGWDLNKGELRWYSKGPEVQRNHWEYASYKIRINTKENIADIQPYGQRHERYEVRVDLLNGQEIKNKNATPSTSEDWRTCDAGAGEVWLGKQYRFRHKGLDFYVLSDGEWLVFDSKKGYFNASSVQALGYLHINKSPLNQTQIKEFYRPDIIQSILQDKPVFPIKHPHYQLAKKSVLSNVYKSNIKYDLDRGSIDTKLVNYISQAHMDELSTILNQFTALGSAKDYQAFYNALSRNKNIRYFKKFNKRKNISKLRQAKGEMILIPIQSFLAKRKEHLKENPDEQSNYIWFLSSLNMHDDIQDIIQTHTLTYEAKKSIAHFLQDYDISDPFIFEVSQKEQRYLKQETFERLYEKYPEKTHTLALDIVENKANNMKDYSYMNAIRFLTKQPTVKSTENVLIRIEKFFRKNLDAPECCPSEWPSLAAFYRVYAQPEDVTKIYSTFQSYIKKNLIKQKLDRRKVRFLISLLQQMLLDMNDYDVDFSRSIQKQLLYSSQDKMVISELLNLRDPEVARETMNYIANKYRQTGLKDPDIFNKFNYVNDPQILREFIKMLNSFDDCMKIDNLTKMNLLRNLSVREYADLKCHTIPLGLVPSNKKEAYEILLQE